MITRRRFVAATLGAGAALATQGCATTPTAGKRMIVDAQVHLWKAASAWPPGIKPQMPEPFTIEKLLPMMDEAGVDRAVVVPPSVAGNDYGLEAARRYPSRFGVMGRIRLGLNFIPTSVRPVGSIKPAAMLVRGVDRYHHFECVEPPRAELDEQSIATHEWATTLYRNGYLEEEARHARLSA